jgi:hypothetical protein
MTFFLNGGNGLFSKRRKPSTESEKICTSIIFDGATFQCPSQAMCIFKPKITIWVNFGGSCNGRCWNILGPFGMFYVRPFSLFCGHLVYFMVIWYIFPVLVFCTNENLATLVRVQFAEHQIAEKLLNMFYKLCTDK